MLTFQLATYGTEKRLRLFLDGLLNNTEQEATQVNLEMHAKWHLISFNMSSFCLARSRRPNTS